MKKFLVAAAFSTTAAFSFEATQSNSLQLCDNDDICAIVVKIKEDNYKLLATKDHPLIAEDFVFEISPDKYANLVVDLKTYYIEDIPKDSDSDDFSEDQKKDKQKKTKKGKSKAGEWGAAAADFFRGAFTKNEDEDGGGSGSGDGCVGCHPGFDSKDHPTGPKRN